MLSKIQPKIKAPKSNFNEFGKYKYRSMEDINESVKPVLAELGIAFVMSDEIILIGDRYYIKATATLLKDDGTIVAQCCGYAREEETKKGMDASQITGSCSSYARKYAANGLFAIDDTKDADATNQHDKAETKKPAAEPTTKDALRDQAANDTCAELCAEMERADSLESLAAWAAASKPQIDALPEIQKNKVRGYYRQIEAMIKEKSGK
jgi:hypothetical protein